MKLLVVEDEAPIAEALVYNLSADGYQVLTADSGEAALRLARSAKPDLILLDVMLPGASGFQLCRVIRQESAVPIIMLTAKTSESDRVIGLELGADDYVTKPFSMRELLARVKSVLRRSAKNGEPSGLIQAGDITVDTRRHEAKVAGRIIELTRKEFGLLALLAAYPEQVFSRSTLLDRVWGPDAFVEERTVDVHVRWLRLKIEDNPSRPARLLTVHGVGYKLVVGR